MYDLQGWALGMGSCNAQELHTQVQSAYAYSHNAGVLLCPLLVAGLLEGWMSTGVFPA